MTRLLFMVFLALLLVALSACNLGESAVYGHLQDQNPGAIHTTGPDSLPELDEDGEGVSDLAGYCEGEFSAQERAYRDLERRAITEKDPSFCMDIPDEPLIVDCPDQALILYYSKQRCLEYFKE